MNVKDNSLKYMLRNVYFIGGTNCGGKSSMARHLSEKHNMILYSADEAYMNHRKQTDKKNQPAMNREFIGWDEFFTRDIEDKSEWLLASEEEEMDFILLDLIALSNEPDKKVVCDIHCMPKLFEKVSDYHRVMFLLADEDLVYDEYFEREDKASMLKVIKEKTSNPELAIKMTKNTAKLIAQKEIARVLASPFKFHYRTNDSSFYERVELVEKHFKLI